jgi:hypothetical protein
VLYCYFFWSTLIAIKTLHFGLWLWNAVVWCITCNTFTGFIYFLHLLHKGKSVCVFHVSYYTQASNEICCLRNVQYIYLRKFNWITSVCCGPCFVWRSYRAKTGDSSLKHFCVICAQSSLNKHPLKMSCPSSSICYLQNYWSNFDEI